MNESAGELDQLSAAQKRQLLAELLNKQTALPKDRSLSVGQERLYRLVQLTPLVPLYNIAVAYRLLGPLNIGSIEQAVRHIEDRHEILRTTFSLVDGTPMQRVAPPHFRSETLLLVNLEPLLPIDRPKRASEIVESEIKRVIDVSKGPLWRLAIICLSECEHVLVLTMHHIVSDGWSFDLFLKELSTLYVGGVHISQPIKLDIQYSDYAARQKESLVGSEFERQRRYWAEQLSGPIQPLRLPAEHLKANENDRVAASFPFALSTELSQSLVNLGQRQGATLFMTLLAGFGALLHGSTHQEDLLLCTPVTGRHRPQSKELIGYFNNILPIRLDLSGDPSLLDLLGRTRRVALDAFNNQDVPFHWNADLPTLRRISLSRLLFSLDMEWPPRLQLTGVTCESTPIDTGAADFDLSVSLWTRAGQILGNLRYKRRLFEEATIAELIESYRALLTIFAAEPQRTLSSLRRFASGREQDQRPAANVQDQGTDDPLSNWPRSAIELRLVQEWENELDQRPIGIHDHLQSLGASSLAVASLALRVQKAFGTTVPITEIFQAGTIAKMAALLQSRDKSLSNSPLAPIQPHGRNPPLFLCEGVGIYFPLVPYLGDDQPVYGLVTEIVENFPDVPSLASHYVGVVLEAQPNGPYNLGGVSFGGLVAFEMAQQLQALGRKVSLLALMETPGPGAYRLKPPFRRAVGHIKNVARYGYPYLRTKIKLPKFSEQKHVDERSRAETLRTVFVQRAANYQPKPYRGRIMLFMLSQRSAMNDSLFDPELGDISPSLGWESIALGGLESYELKGEHVSILREPFVRELGERLREGLNRQQQEIISTCIPTTRSS